MVACFLCRHTEQCRATTSFADDALCVPPGTREFDNNLLMTKTPGALCRLRVGATQECQVAINEFES